MSKLDNATTYKELLLPAYPAYKSLIYLDQYYGMYDCGAIIFYDIDTLYILKSNGKVTAKREEEWLETVICIPENDQTIPGNAMIRQPNEKIFYCSVAESDMNHQKSSIAKNESIGTKMRIIMSDGTEITDLKSDQEVVDKQNENIVYIKKENIYTESIFRARLLENEDNCYISANNLDIMAFTPNKTFKIVYTETVKNERYSGTYRLSYAYHVIKLESESFMSASHHIVLKRTENPVK
jgi:hypothetical protein